MIRIAKRLNRLSTELLSLLRAIPAYGAGHPKSRAARKSSGETGIPGFSRREEGKSDRGWRGRQLLGEK